MASNRLDEDEYNSADDEDFNPNQQILEHNDSNDSSSEAEDDAPVNGRKPKRRRQADDEGDFENSGDESVIKKSKRKRSGKNVAPNGAEGEDEEHWVKTRAQRKAEVNQKKPLPQANKSSIDVDILWAQMSNKVVQTHSSLPAPQEVVKSSLNGDSKRSLPDDPSADSRSQPMTSLLTDPAKAPQQESHEANVTGAEPAMITIKRVYKFAGEIQEEERTVPADSAEARLYLQQKAAQETADNTNLRPTGLRRPVKKKTSIFADKADTTTTTANAKGVKLTTLEKSKLDWAAHVDEEGIADELDTHRRAKDTYIGRLDFLSRMDAKRDEGAQSRKLK